MPGSRKLDVWDEEERFVTQHRDPDAMMMRAKQIAPLLDERGSASRQAGRLTDDVIAALIDSEVLRMFVPRELGGCAMRLAEGAMVIEELTRADGPSGWCAMAAGATTGTAAAFLPEAGAVDLFSQEESARIVGLLAATAQTRAERTNGGYVFTGRGQFASGSRMATHFVLAGIVFDGESPSIGPTGGPATIVGFIPRDGIQFGGNWDVDGLEPTESIDYEVSSIFVEERMTFFTDMFQKPALRGAAHVLGLRAYGFAMHGAIALGLARRLLEEVAVLAPSRGRPGGGKLADQELFNHELAMCDMQLSACRTLFYDFIGIADQECTKSGNLLPDTEERRLGALVSFIHVVGMQCADFAYSWAGSVAFRNKSAIGRFYHDMNIARNHIQADRTNIAAAGPAIRERLVRARSALRS